jgi:hypothetical protein
MTCKVVIIAGGVTRHSCGSDTKLSEGRFLEADDLFLNGVLDQLRARVGNPAELSPIRNRLWGQLTETPA